MKTTKKHDTDQQSLSVDYIKMHTVRPRGTRENQKKKKEY